MEVSGGSSIEAERWANIQCLLCRGSPLAHPEFEPSPDVSSVFVNKGWRDWIVYVTLA
jgi:hypothetical protein